MLAIRNIYNIPRYRIKVEESTIIINKKTISIHFLYFSCNPYLVAGLIYVVNSEEIKAKKGDMRKAP